MKILVINTVPFHQNGITSVILNYFRHMDLNGIRMEILAVTEMEEEFRKEIEQRGGRVRTLPCSRHEIPVYFRAFRKLLRSEHYDIVHIHGNSAMMSLELLGARLEGVPVRIAHGHNTTCRNLLLHKICYPVFSVCCTQGFACGEEAGNWLYGKRPHTIIKNGINIKQYSFSENTRNRFREKLNLPDSIILGHVGLFNYQKNHEFLIDIMEALEKEEGKYHLLLVGFGETYERIYESVEKRNLLSRVTFAGRVNNVCDYLQAMDLLLLPSRFEGLPLALVEAQAAGLPCLVSDRVSREARMSSFLEFLPIDQGYGVWKEAILHHSFGSRQKQCQEAAGKLGIAGYDIRKNARELKELYLQYSSSPGRRAVYDSE